jgi:hypothetical protein
MKHRIRCNCMDRVEGTWIESRQCAEEALYFSSSDLMDRVDQNFRRTSELDGAIAWIESIEGVVESNID